MNRHPVLVTIVGELPAFTGYQPPPRSPHSYALVPWLPFPGFVPVEPAEVWSGEYRDREAVFLIPPQAPDLAFDPRKLYADAVRPMMFRAVLFRSDTLQWEGLVYLNCEFDQQRMLYALQDVEVGILFLSLVAELCLPHPRTSNSFACLVRLLRLTR